MSGEAVSSFIRNYSNYFFIDTFENDECIVLKDGITTELLREEFRARLPIELLYSFTCKASMEALGLAA
jgi:hypothetical protein